MSTIPSTVIAAFAEGEILHVLLFAVFFGFALHRFGGRGRLVFDLIEKSTHVLFVILGTIMKVAPIGAFRVFPKCAFNVTLWQEVMC